MANDDDGTTFKITVEWDNEPTYREIFWKVNWLNECLTGSSGENGFTSTPQAADMELDTITPRGKRLIRLE